MGGRNPAHALARAAQLAAGIGPRRSAGPAEARAAQVVTSWLREAGAEPSLHSFTGPASFAPAQAVAPALALAARVSRGHARDRILGATALGLAAAEGDPRRQPLTRLLGRRASANVTASVEPLGERRRTACLVSHLDSSRSGLLFHPALAPWLRPFIATTTIALALRAAASIMGGRPAPLATLGRASSWPLAAGLLLLAERELRGEDVPGANDNASGVAVAATVFGEIAKRPLRTTRVVFLATGCEESGTVGMRSFLEEQDTDGWLFVNLDGVGARATLRYLPREGVGWVWPADPGLVEAADALAQRRPELGLARAERLVGLTFDATQVLARGGRAITLSAQDGTIPNYHTPSDVVENLDPDVLARTCEIVRELLRALDRGETDPAR